MSRPANLPGICDLNIVDSSSRETRPRLETTSRPFSARPKHIGFGLLVLGLTIGCFQHPSAVQIGDAVQSRVEKKIFESGAAEAEGAPTAFVVPRDQITQISIINALMLGQYDGITTFGELLEYGDFGVGTLNQLDGELIVLDGQGYQVHSDGSVALVDASAKTPFAVVTPFDQTEQQSLPQIESLEWLDERLNEGIGHPNQFIAIRIHADFATITLRSVKAQSPPYRPLGVVAKEQSVWTREKVAGTLIGIRCPAWVQGLNVPGYHWHFLSDDHTIGGHVLKCTAGSATAYYDVCREWLVRLVDSPGFDTSDLHQDLNRELRSVESARDSEARTENPEK